MNGYGVLRRVYVRPPDARSLASWEAFGWHHAPDPRSIGREHLAFREQLAEAGAEVITGATPGGRPRRRVPPDEAGPARAAPRARGDPAGRGPRRGVPDEGPQGARPAPEDRAPPRRNTHTRRRLEAVGVDVRVYRGAHVSL